MTRTEKKRSLLRYSLEALY